MASTLQALVKQLASDGGDKAYRDAEALHTVKVFRGPEIRGMLRNTAQSKRKIATFFTPTPRMKYDVCQASLSWVLEIVHSVSTNTIPAYTPGNLKGSQLCVVPGARNVSAVSPQYNWLCRFECMTHQTNWCRRCQWWEKMQ